MSRDQRHPHTPDQTDGLKGDTTMIEQAGVDRRGFLKVAGGVAAVAGGMVWAGRVLEPVAAAAAPGAPDLYLAGTDGWIYLPPTPAIPPFHPDVLAPSGLTTYIFGFRNVTGMDTVQKQNQKNKAQHSAPLFWVKQYDPAHPVDFTVKLTNLGLALRPDLFDAHTLHWHGFRNVIPFFDGEPSGSVAVPSGREFTYVYRPRDPGTYMYHCHVEDVEHVHMGMTGMVFVRPLQDGNTSFYPSGRYLYNDGNGSTGYDREFAMFLSEVWAEAHWADAHIQLPEWSDYRADFSLLNGRVYPDTIAPNGSIDPFHPVTDANGDLIPVPGSEQLQVPAALLPHHLQRGRAGRAALREPRVPRAGDDDLRNPDAGRRAGRDPDAGTRRHGHLLRDRHAQHRPRRELRRGLHRTGPSGTRRLRHLHALQPQLHPLQQPRPRWVRRCRDRDPRLCERCHDAGVSERLGGLRP